MTQSQREQALKFPATRYAGSKRKLLSFLHGVFCELEFSSALDPFCGSGAVAYLLKCMGKRVTASDALQFNAVCARALIANPSVRLNDTLSTLLRGIPLTSEPAGFVETAFHDIFFTPDENRFIDQALARIHTLPPEACDMARWCLFQACLLKRPYNLFHRANLSMRTNDVPRSFGNKATWDTPFDVHLKKLALQADNAIFDSGVSCCAAWGEALSLNPAGFDLVYLDPPYINAKGSGVDYLDHYHFLDGLLLGPQWGDRILHKFRHKPLAGKGGNPWTDPARIHGEFQRTIGHFAGSTLVISYRSDGIPSIEDICGYLRNAGKQVRVFETATYTYALSTNRTSREVVILGK